MKKNIAKFTSIVLLAALLITTGGCKKLKDFGDTNISPNGVSEPILSALLTNTQLGLSGTFPLQAPASLTSQEPAFFCQYFAEATYPGISRYTGLDIDASRNYRGTLMDLQVIINKCSDPSYGAKAVLFGDLDNQIAIASLLQSYIFWTLTDRWGDLPYSEALSGAVNLLPKYDSQQVIYKGILTKIENALTSFNPSGIKVTGDVVYAGDVSKWRKFGNSLRMLVALRMSKRYPSAGGFAATEFNKSLNSPYGFISANADNFSIDYPGGVFRNPFNALNISQDVAVALTFTDALNGMGDTRRSSMVSLANGCPYGLTGAAPLSSPYGRTFNGTFANEASRLVIVNTASVQLARAEAIERGWVPGLSTADAKLAYDAAISSSFEQWGQTIPSAYLSTIADYNTGVGGGSIGGSSVAGSNTTTATKLDRIALQQWIAFYPSGIQGWSNWRRTGIPDIKPTVFPNNPGGMIPRRFTYGIADYTSNKVQVDIAVARIPGAADSQDAKIWWDQ